MCKKCEEAVQDPVFIGKLNRLIETANKTLEAITKIPGVYERAVMFQDFVEQMANIHNDSVMESMKSVLQEAVLAMQTANVPPKDRV